jgi:hypothetical protein
VGTVINFPSRGDIEFHRTVRALERFMSDYLAGGPKINGKVKFDARHISTDKALKKGVGVADAARRRRDMVKAFVLPR